MVQNLEIGASVGEGADEEASTSFGEDDTDDCLEISETTAPKQSSTPSPVRHERVNNIALFSDASCSISVSETTRVFGSMVSLFAQIKTFNVAFLP